MITNKNEKIGKLLQGKKSHSTVIIGEHIQVNTAPIF